MKAPKKITFPQKLHTRLTEIAAKPEITAPVERAEIALQGLVLALDILESAPFAVMERMNTADLYEQEKQLRFDHAIHEQLARLEALHRRALGHFSKEEAEMV